jgi:cystathionine beta-lyase/cystathionine gamma-synthase
MVQALHDPGGDVDVDPARLYRRPPCPAPVHGVRHVFASAALVADWLRAYPLVERVAYLGDAPVGSAEAEVIARQCGAMGATFSFVVKGGREAAFKVLDSLEVFKLAVSLGGAESLACHPGSTTHSGVSANEQAILGMEEGLIRLSIGLEAPSDLIADLGRGLERVG